MRNLKITCHANYIIGKATDSLLVIKRGLYKLGDLPAINHYYIIISCVLSILHYAAIFISKQNATKLELRPINKFYRRVIRYMTYYYYMICHILKNI